MAAQVRPGNSGVRNLAAMFENKDENATSPPNRGRSPAGSLGARSNAPSPRPLSKVRTSFVAVERSGQLGGQLGLVKTISNSNSNSTGTEDEMKDRREAFSIDEESHPVETAVRKMSLASEITARRQSTVITETIPENALSTPMESPRPALTESTSYMNATRVAQNHKLAPSSQNGNPDKLTDVEDTEAKLLPADTTDEDAVSGGKALQRNNIATPTSMKSSKKAAKSPSSSKNGTSISKGSTRPSPISTQPSTTGLKEEDKASGSPRAARTPRTPKTSNMTSSTSSTAAISSEPKGSAQTKSLQNADETVVNEPPKPIHGGSANGSEHTSNGVATKSISSVPVTTSLRNEAPKPRMKVKPATRPGPNSSSIMAPTSSSLSKISSTSTSLPKQQLQHDPAQKQTAKRSTSNATMAQSTSSSVQRNVSSTDKAQPSGRSRPSLGSTPADTIKKQPSRQSLPKHPDESFLARMMRSTAASASKVHEKVVTPPRTKIATKQHAKDDPSTRNPAQPSIGSPFLKNSTSAQDTSKVFEDFQDATSNANGNGSGDIDETKVHEAKEPLGASHKPELEATELASLTDKAAATDKEAASPTSSKSSSHIKHEEIAPAASATGNTDHAASNIKEEQQPTSAGPTGAADNSNGENRAPVVLTDIEQEIEEENSQPTGTVAQNESSPPSRTDDPDATTLEQIR